MADDTVRVAVRVRPLVSSEVDQGYQDILNVIQPENQIQVKNNKVFTFDYVFGPICTQDEFYETAVSDMINKLFEGYNVTILAYGQTGSGKTYSMGTSYLAGESIGVIPRAVNDIFNSISNQSHKFNYRVTVSFMELYNEQLYDLLTNKNREDCIVNIREDTNKEIKIQGITEKQVNNANETLQFLIQGSRGRATGSTSMNNQSSRSHAIFTMVVFQESKDNPGNATIAKFSLVDLAGSERSKKAQVTGERFKESVNINKSLLTLGNVISQLGNNTSNSFVSYRDSKLTRLLQDSLGGNSITLMIACVSPADYNLEETLSTLRYADRAKKIKNKPIVNQDSTSANINSLQTEVVNLQLALASKGPMQGCPPEHAELIEKNKLLQEQLCSQAENAKKTICSDLKKILEDFEKILKDESSENCSKKKLKRIQTKLEKLLDQEQSMDAEINQQVLLEQIPKCHSSTTEADEDEESFRDNSHLDEEYAEHTVKQDGLNKEVQNINQNLAVKEELISQLLCGSPEINDLTKKVQEMESKMKRLMAERDKLVETLKNVDNNLPNAELVELQCKKIQKYEKKITELTRQVTEQNNIIIKSKEKSDQQIKKLTNKIQTLKQTREELIHEMRKESDEFTQYQQQWVNKCSKLEDQDRKRKNQMTRMQDHVNNLQNKYEKKIEECNNLQKQLKNTLKTEAQRSKAKNSSSEESIQSLIITELNERAFYTQFVQKLKEEKLINEVESIQAILDSFNKYDISEEMAQIVADNYISEHNNI